MGNELLSSSDVISSLKCNRLANNINCSDRVYG